MKHFVHLMTITLIFCFTVSIYADYVPLEEHFNDDPLVRGWSTGGTDPMTWQASEGNSGAMCKY